MANTTTSTSTLFTKLLVEAQFQAYENSVARQITTVFDVAGQPGKVIDVPVYDAVTAGDLTEATAPTSQTGGTTNVPITMGEIGIYHAVSDFLRDSAARDVFADLGMQMGMAVAEKMDTDVFSLFSSATTSVGADDTEVTADTILKGVATLRANKVVGPYFCVLHPKVAYNVKKQLANTGASTVPSLSDAGNRILDGYQIGTIANCTVIESGLIPAASDANNFDGAIFSRDALGLAIRGEPTLKTEDKAASRSTDLMLSVQVGQAILNQSKIVGVKGDGTL